jgi:acyl dehydratase
MSSRIAVGERASLDHAFSAEDVVDYIRISGDDNPIHRDAAAARAAGFEREVVHGLLVTSLVSRMLGTQLPGPGTILLGVDLRYLRPVHVDEQLSVSVEVASVREDKPIAGLNVIVQTTEDVIRGEVVVKLPPSAWAASQQGEG